MEGWRDGGITAAREADASRAVVIPQEGAQRPSVGIGVRTEMRIPTPTAIPTLPLASLGVLRDDNRPGRAALPPSLHPVVPPSLRSRA